MYIKVVNFCVTMHFKNAFNLCMQTVVKHPILDKENRSSNDIKLARLDLQFYFPICRSIDTLC